MRILVIDPCAATLDWSMRCQNEGHKVKWYVPNMERTKYVGKNIIERVSDYRDWMRWADIVFLADNTKYLRDMDVWRREGIPIIGPTQELADWELNRGIGQDILKKHGIKTIPSKVFSDYDQAINYVKKEMKRFVSKPSGDADKALSYCSKSPSDMIYMLERWKKLGKLKSPFILQEFIPGIEMAVGAWVGKNGFARGWCENWEFKKLMNDDCGVATGEQGTVLRYVANSKLANKVLKPLEDILVSKGYTGYIDVNCIIDEKGTPWPLEFTCRPGYPLFNIQQALHKGDHAEWLMDLWEGKDPKAYELDKIALGVVLSIPDYPYSHITRKEVVGIPIYGLNTKVMENVHLCETMLGEAPTEVMEKIITMPCFTTAGDYVLVVSATGQTVLEAKNGAYRVLKKLSVPNSPMWRTDIGSRLKKQLPELQSMGYALQMDF